MSGQGASHGDSSVGMGILKLLIAIFLSVVVYYSGEHVAAWMQAFTTAAVQAEIPRGDTDVQRAIPGMKETNDALINWAILLISGTVAIAILAKGARIQDDNWGLVLILPIWTTLYGSLLRGLEFKSMLTYQQFHDSYSFALLNDQLLSQQQYFQASMLLLAILAIWFLVFRFSHLEAT